jgi:hypothetical protein
MMHRSSLALIKNKSKSSIFLEKNVKLLPFSTSRWYIFPEKNCQKMPGN